MTTPAGRTTYPIDGTTQLVKDGQPVASLSAMHVGDRVLLHVYPLNGSTHVERVIDGLPGGEFGPGPGPDDGGDGATTST